MDLKEILTLEKAREDTYKILSTLFYLPEDDLFEIGILDDLVSSAEIIAADLAKQAVDLKEEDIADVQRLKVDYSQLFVGPFDLLAPPYGSIYLDNSQKVMEESTIDALNQYQKAGLKVADDFKDVPDHVIMELEFLYYLTFNQFEAIDSSNFEAAKQHYEAQKDFLNNHLGKWISEFTNKVINNAETEFYKKLVNLTNDFVIKDQQEVLNKVGLGLEKLKKV